MLKLTWVQAETFNEEKPADIEKETYAVRIRKEIKKVPATEEQGSKWTYLEAKLSHEQYTEYTDMLAELDTPLANALRTDNETQLEAQVETYEAQLQLQQQNEEIKEQNLAIIEMIVAMYEGSLTE